MKKALYMVTVLGIAMIGFAQDQGTKYYIGAGYQTGTFGGDDGADELDQSQGGYVSFGSKPFPWLAVEARLGVSIISMEESLSDDEIRDILVDGGYGYLPPELTFSGKNEFTFTGVNVDLLLKPTYQIQQFSIYGILGASFMFYNLEDEATVTASYKGESETESESYNETDSDFGFVLGGGVAYDFGAVGINAEVSTYQYGDFDLTPLFSIGGTFNF